MIPLHKFKDLPRTLRLRKAASLAGGAERRFIVTEKLPPGEAAYFCEIIELLINDEAFAGAAAAALKNAQANLTNGNIRDIRRALNSVYHIILAETGRPQADWDFIESPGVLDISKRRPFQGMQVYFEDIRSPFNVGSMFRAAESFGVEKIWLSPLCADPRHKRAERTAMGCVDVIPWERFLQDPFAAQDTPSGIPAAFSAGPFFTLETGGIPLADFPFPAGGIMIAGSEELGVSPPALEKADASLGRVTIPSYGAKGSLNVSVAFGIVMQAWAESYNPKTQALC